jgi:protein gp37
MSTTTTEIAWCDRTWNPTKGCSRVSPGCQKCYAEGIALRFSREGLPFHGFVKRDARGKAQWTGKVEPVPDALGEPLSWQKPARVFVNSMSDLFHEELSNENIAAVFGVMAAARQHTFQILTKRAERMREWFAWLEREAHECNAGKGMSQAARCLVEAQRASGGLPKLAREVDRICATPWPLPNVWLGVSVEDQKRADERIPYLRQTPAAIRFLSCEPLLEPIDISRHLWPVHDRWPATYRSSEEARAAGATVTRHRQALVSADARFIDWIIVGGESGGRARPCDPAWLRALVTQGQEAGAAVFVKQLGSLPVEGLDVTGNFRTDPKTGNRQIEMTGRLVPLRHKKGGDMHEWPEDLRVQDFPKETP